MVKDCSEKHVAVKVNLGRNKSVSYLGTLSGIYPSLFTVQPDDKGFLGKTTYSYSDVLCGNVKIKMVSQSGVAVWQPRFVYYNNTFFKNLPV